MAAPGGDRSVPTRTPLVLLWATLTLAWSIFAKPHKTFAARNILFQPAWALRMYSGDSRWSRDILLFLVLHAAYTYWLGTWRIPALADARRIDFSDHTIRIYLEIFGLLGGCGFFSGGIVRRGQQLESGGEDEHVHERRIDEQLLPPLLIPSRTTHSRMTPRRHAFSYSYLFVGIPVGLHGSIGNVLSVDTERKCWFHVRASDYLVRGYSGLHLASKLKRYLHTQGVTDRDYAFAYLVTAPRFLGYSFNPVSFWYLYDSDARVRYMILEVNNTFDERRMYLLEADVPKLDEALEPAADEAGSQRGLKSRVFTETFAKDFHVSPFNSRKGKYSLRATDPLAAYEETGKVRIDNTVVLRTSQDDKKLVARVFSEGNVKNAAQISNLELAAFVASWWWVGLITFPRIVWQAQKLFFRRKLHVWYRPEVAGTSIGRTYTSQEVQLETFFRLFLAKAVRHSVQAIRVVYEAAHAEGEEVVLYSPGLTYEEAHRRTLTLKVLSPAFYSRFVHYAHAKEAFDRESLTSRDENRTLQIEDATLLPALLEAMARRDHHELRKQSLLSQVRWSWLRRLRCPPVAASYKNDEKSDYCYNASDIRAFGFSELDSFVKQYATNKETYRRIASELFLAQRSAFGIPELISFYDACLIVMLWTVAIYSCRWSTALDPLRIAEVGPRTYGSGDVWAMGVTIVLANAAHMWSFLKG